MKRIVVNSLISSIIVASLAGCAKTQPPVFNMATPKYDSPPLINVPAKRADYSLVYHNDPALERAFNQYVKTGTPPNIITDGFVKYAYNAGQQPVIKVAPFEVVVISLETGERFTNVTSGDPNRLSYAIAVSGTGANAQQHILVKPASTDIATNLVITTDKRIYNIRLVASVGSRPTRDISFWYPQEMVDDVNNQIIKQTSDGSVSSVPDVSLNNLNFNYSASGGVFSSPSWKPIRVFDDGTHTYIQFPVDMTNRDMPALFVSNGSSQELVNYRSKPPYFVVDKIFKQAVLVMGVGMHQTKITITNNAY